MMRWKMERAGIFNFWYYDDQDFHFSNGRLILRGANGSGKSVTMQSFIPLVLDGDKRPWRLDPFGSRDRRVEYYLLGEADSGIHERTGYLYLEFKHGKSEKSLTIGIGMRARKGISGLGFWGFAIEDGRRIGKDFFLYDEHHYEKYGEKIPLTRDKLTEMIGAGGKVVREQAAYRKMVNRLLFGFDEEESYQELLDLLIQLRSPKLSKDFKPSTIYDILTDALPPLKEEELRPLSEVLEDMDQINDTLDELQIHAKEVERLNNSYTKYNQFQLFNASRQLRKSDKHYMDKKKDVAATKNELSEHAEQLAKLEAEKEQLSRQANEWSTEIDILEQHEALEKHRELDEAKTDQREITAQLKNTRERLSEVEKRLQLNKREQQETKMRIEQERQVIEARIEEMEGLAREAEFREHDLYHRQFEREEELSAGNWQAWKTDISAHRKRLQKALQLSQDEERAKERLEEAESTLSETREERDELELKLRAEEQRFQDVLHDYEDRFYNWFRGLTKLPLSESSFRDMLHLLSDYPTVPFNEVKQPALEIYEETKENRQRELTKIAHEQQLLQDEQKRINEELKEWQTKKDPEPARRESREKYRQARLEGVTDHETIYDLGAPLYACCDFREELKEEEKAQIESVLEYTGLLDAWIGPAQIVTEGSIWHDGIEEFMLLSEPVTDNRLGTLADVLKPEISDERSINEDDVWRALRSIRFDRDHLQDELLRENASGAWVNHHGQFQLGTLFGQVEIKPKAQYIGKQAREKMRAEMIEQLQNQQREVENKLRENERKQEEICSSIDTLKDEIEALPTETVLLEADRAKKDAAFDVERAQKQLEKADHFYREQLHKWRKIQHELNVLTDEWSKLKKRERIEQAVLDLQAYEISLGELRSHSQIFATYEGRLNQLAEEIEASEERREREEEQVLEWKRKERENAHKIETLTSLLKDLGILNIYERLEKLKQWRQEAINKVNRLDGEVRAVDRNKVRCEERLVIMENDFMDIETERNKALKAWENEWERKLLPEWEDDWTAQELEESKILTLAKKVEQAYRANYQNMLPDKAANDLLQVFNEVKNVLLDYVLEAEYADESNRWLIHSVRDRHQPLTPGKLLEELRLLEEEQKRLMDEKDRELYEQIILHSIGKAIRHKIYRAEQWVKQMNRLMDERKTSSGLKLSLKWEPRPPRNEAELDVELLVDLLRKDPDLLRDDEIEQMVDHFRSRIRLAKDEAGEKDSLRKWIADFLDYRQWFDFVLYYRKGEQNKRELTDARFNVLSGGEKAMSMYIPLFAATYSRYSDSNPDSPKLISLDEAFAGVDDENIRDLFQLLTDMDFDYMMTSQVLWGCYDTVPNLSIYEIIRPKDVDYVTLLRYHWNGHKREMIVDEPLLEDEDEMKEPKEEWLTNEQSQMTLWDE